MFLFIITLTNLFLLISSTCLIVDRVVRPLGRFFLDKLNICIAKSEKIYL